MALRPAWAPVAERPRPWLQKLALAWLRHEVGRRADAELRATERGPPRGVGQQFRAVVQVNLLPRAH